MAPRCRNGIAEGRWYTPPMDDQALLEQALALPQEARAKLAGKLLSSLDDDTPDADAAEAWARVIKQRIDEVDRGIVETISRDHFAAKLNAAVHGKTG